MAWFLLTRLFPSPGEEAGGGGLVDLEAWGRCGAGEADADGVPAAVVLWVVGRSPPLAWTAALLHERGGGGLCIGVLFMVKALGGENARTISWDMLIIGSGPGAGRGLVCPRRGAVDGRRPGGMRSWAPSSSWCCWRGRAWVTVMLTAVCCRHRSGMFIPMPVGLSRSLGVSPERALVLTCGLSVSLSFITPIGTRLHPRCYSTRSAQGYGQGRDRHHRAVDPCDLPFPAGPPTPWACSEGTTALRKRRANRLAHNPLSSACNSAIGRDVWTFGSRCWFGWG